MKKCLFGILMACIFFCAAVAIGCQKSDENEKISDLEFTVVPASEVPQELKTVIEQKKEGEFRLTYGSGGDLYLAVGYGKQPTGGYSIQVPEFYLTKNNVVVDTILVGPEKSEAANLTFPYIVLKTEWREESVLFQ